MTGLDPVICRGTSVDRGLDWRPPRRPVVDLFERSRDIQQSLLAKPRRDQLQSDRQTVGGEAGGD
jgi:hypothetical protein